jgi:excisionase family DNA binding protein
MTPPVAALLTVAQTAERLSLSRKTTYRKIAEGEIPAVRLGGPGAAVRVPTDELEAWLYAPAFDERNR